ncbi:hypothetical protein PFICI_06944 [Pestalotiopsis fici W106-1]|uniref:SET domain-containing protein n=1 Tax=Pestalotiopsis fici (strain W106-1 / CGMCC3.15140) TaxID=1229662 RepID=W3X967_PESFW|nr:uncharacterized protein PFICI_06944 [Pestalotiopsis fici W106-1]ETS81942.1 hypothetical protein PFICI_06944 [Pestalotiopsis fici W106-1]
MSAPEEVAQMGPTSNLLSLENSESHSNNHETECILGDQIQKDGGNSAIPTENVGNLSVQEPIEPSMASGAKPLPYVKLNRDKDPKGVAFLTNLYKGLQTALEDGSESDNDDQNNAAKGADTALRSKCWTENSSSRVSETSTDEDRPEGPTHQGHPWESDEEDDSDSEFDDDEDAAGKEHRETSLVTYKTAFGPITLDTTQNAAIMDDNCSVIVQTHQKPAATTPGVDLITDDTTRESVTMKEDHSEINQTLPRSVSAPIGPMARPESFRNEFYEVKQSATAGYGAFALQKLVEGQTILIEKSLFHAHDKTLRSEIRKLSPELRRAFDRMHGNGIHEHSTILERRDAKFKTNTFMMNQQDQGVFLTASKFNHACVPNNNVAYTYDKQHDCMVFTVERDIEAGDELFITYGKDPEDLFKQYGFICRCRSCQSLTHKQIEKIRNYGL